MKRALLFLSVLVVLFASCSRIMDIEDELDEQSAIIAVLEQYRHYTLYSYNVTTAQGSDGKIKQLPSELSSDFTLIQTDILQYISLTE